MKRLLSLAAALFLLFSVQAQETNKLFGTWEIKHFQYGDHPNNNEWHTAFKKYKSYTPTHFIVTEVNLATNVTSTSIFGTYEIKEGIYTEHILHVNKESAGMIGQRFSFTLSFDGDNKMYSTGSFNGMKSSELWERVSKSDLMVQKSPPLYVIKNGDKFVTLKPGTGKESPLSLISPSAIASIEVIKDVTATALFQERGKNGVIIITIIEESLQKTLELLKSKGIATDI